MKYAMMEKRLWNIFEDMYRNGTKEEKVLRSAIKLPLEEGR